MDVLKQLLGRLHPLLVHLPIGFIIFGFLVQWLDRKKKEYQKFIPIAFYWGGFFAIAACITGYLQYLGEGYAFETIKWHLWLGIATAVFSFLMYFKLTEKPIIPIPNKIPTLLISILFFILISLTGHLGGNITHGDDYLTEPLPNSIKSALGAEIFEIKEISLNQENWEDALIYQDVVQPILNNKCVSCHNPKKAKGDLLIHSTEGILKGGENGEIISANNAEKSDLFIRMELPMDDDNHMPPEGKSQPSKEEIKLIGEWINAGNPFEGTIKKSGLSKDLFLSFFPKKTDYDYPNIEVIAASQDSINAIENTGIHIDLISKASNFLSVSCINKPDFTDADFDKLLAIKSQIARVDFGNTQISDAIFEKLASFPNLTILKLDDTSVSGKNIESLAALQYLKSINLTNTNFKNDYLNAFNNFKTLQKVFLFNTKVVSKEIKSLRDGQIIIDHGGYDLPQISSDSIIY